MSIEKRQLLSAAFLAAARVSCSHCVGPVCTVLVLLVPTLDTKLTRLLLGRQAEATRTC